uniref:Putative ovule protein n=1 Tax=Solanum chacoense TaxID=4108 RepID=A0A0V0IKL9_SOLCH
MATIKCARIEFIDSEFLEKASSNRVLDKLFIYFENEENGFGINLFLFDDHRVLASFLAPRLIPRIPATSH